MQNPRSDFDYTPIAQRVWPILLWVLIIAGSYVRIQTCLTYNPMGATWSDPGRHWSYAVDDLHRDPFTAADGIGYQAWLAAVARITIGDPLAIGIYAGLLSVITCWIWYRFFRELVNNKTVALAGWAFLTWLPSWIGIFSYFMTETLYLPLLGLAFWLTWRNMRKNTLSSFVWAALSWIATVLTRPVMLPGAIIALLYSLKMQGDLVRRLLVLSLIVICTFLPVAYRNYKLIGMFNPLPIQMFCNIYSMSGRREIQMHLTRPDGGGQWCYIFCSPSMGTKPLAPFSDWESKREGDIIIAVNTARGNSDWADALRMNLPSPKLYLQIWAEDVIFLMLGESWPDCNKGRIIERLNVELRWLWTPLLIAVFVGNIIYLRRNKRLELLPAMVLTTWLLYLLIPYHVYEGRYRKPLEGLLIANMLWLVTPKKDQWNAEKSNA